MGFMDRGNSQLVTLVIPHASERLDTSSRTA